MFGLHGNDGETGLPGTWGFDQESFRGLHGDVVTAEFLHQVKAEIESGVNTPATVEAAVFGDHQLRHPLHLWIFLTKLPGQSPMRGGAFAIEHAGGRDQADARANARDGGAPLPPASQPGDHRCIALQDSLDSWAGRRNEDDVRFSDSVEATSGWI